MIIDLILDRQDGKPYNAREFYNNVMSYAETWPEITNPIADALDSGTNDDVKKALAHYIIENEYNADIIKYIQSVKWLEE